ncbi:putative F-box/LRR-repeat protein At3g18150 [Impatiens glandulifera]|uniref:putative F-box/LRR-repeat protein At3g18150 n=1 Tax=Impatiens glandulifera TaxID=253017 RepID=UPI001FB09F85|nr:putative F-box/LRR-repeat protein At3g18150 [Impatiens glandulifera]
MVRNKSPTNEDDKSGATSKKIARERVDYISQVPRAILHHILLFLPFEYWIILGMVSKQWQDLLSETPVVILDENEIVSKMKRQVRCVLHEDQFRSDELDEFKRRFAEFVNHVLFNHSSCLIKYARLSLQYEPRIIYASNVKNWVHFFMTRDIEMLELSFSSTPNVYCELEGLEVRRTTTAQTFELPHQPFQPKFTSFILNFCKLKASRFGSFMNLKALYLTDVDILDCSIGKFVSKCPVLEDLYLERCSVTDKFFVCKKDLKIKHLNLLNCLTEKWDVYMIDISVPQLTNLLIIGKYLSSSTIRNTTNLVDCSIDIHGRFSDMEQGNFLTLMMINLRNCKTLALSSWCVQILPTLDIELSQQLHGSFTKLTSLRVAVGYVKQELPGIVMLLQSCPCLESLMLEINHKAKDIFFLRLVNDTIESFEPEAFLFEEDNYLENQTQDIFCLQNRLKVLKIYGFMGRNKEIHLIEFLLRKALVLENLVIYHDLPDECETRESPPSVRELHKRRMLQALLDLPRASSVVQVYEEKIEFGDD